jgi:hypothetical protein
LHVAGIHEESDPQLGWGDSAGLRNCSLTGGD